MTFVSFFKKSMWETCSLNPDVSKEKGPLLFVLIYDTNKRKKLTFSLYTPLSIYMSTNLIQKYHKAELSI